LRLARLLGSLFGFTWAMVYAITFLVAFFSPTKDALFSINLYGEAHLEFIWLLLGLPLVIWNFLEDVKNCGARPTGAARPPSLHQKRGLKHQKRLKEYGFPYL